MELTIEKLRTAYNNVPIPDELEHLVNDALRQTMKTNEKQASQVYRHRLTKGLFAGIAALAAAFAIFVAGINLSPAFAEKLGDVPVIGSLVKVLTLREYTNHDETYKMSLKTPGIAGLQNKTLETSLNAKYLAENKALYETFIEDMASLKEAGGGHLGVDSGYVVLTDTERILSIGRYVVNTVGSSSTVFKYDTIDKISELLITLPSLFTDERYVGIISEEIKRQMVAQHRVDPNRFFWVEGVEQNANMPLFDRIAMDQSFYISAEGMLVISFDKYEVAPGSMGVVTFTIPTDILSEVLVSRDYLK